jgi:cbb3-type cytochrome oxidase subunit 3
VSTAEIIQTIIQALGLLSLVFLGITYYLDRQWKRAEAAYQFYNAFDANKDCQLAMFMLDYQSGDSIFEFEYDFPKLSKTVRITYDLTKRQAAMRNPYEQLSEEEQVIRFIFDVYIGYLERVFYLIQQGYFTERELIFYKYWLDKLVSADCEDIRTYAVENSCGVFIPFLQKYRDKIQPRLNKMLRF